MNNDYISLNGKFFPIINRKFTKSEFGGSKQRTLNASYNYDLTNIIGKWSFSFELPQDELKRLETIYDTHTDITLKDYDNSTYTVAWSSDWNPEYLGSDENLDEWYSLSVDFESSGGML